MTQRLIQFSKNHSNAHASTRPNLICFFALISLLAGYISLSNAASTLDSEENQIETNTNISTTEKWAKGRLLITPRAGLAMQEMREALNPHGVRPKYHIEELNLHICELPEGADEVEVMRILKKDVRFKDIELDMLVAPDLNITDPAFGSSWALQKIQAPTAWNTANGDGVIIAILDSGVNGNHPDLAANMVPGWNFFHNNADTTDTRGHGTKVAGVAAAAANNGTGSAGVAWNASIMPIRISNDSGLAYLSTMAQAIRWAADHGAKVANISYSGTAGSSTVKSAADYMRSKGGVVVVSAGNTGSLQNHSATNSLLVASATDSSDNQPSWSSYGPYVDVSAPGVSIYSTTHTGGYSNVSGTSFSSPIVAATAALMLSANSELNPADIDQIIKSTAVDLGATGFDNRFGAGRINAAAAVAAASGLISADELAPTIAITSPTGGQVSGTVPINVNYSDNVGVIRVELRVNGQKIITDTQSPFAFSWNTTTWADGGYLLTAVAFDAVGNQTTSSIVSVTINNAPPPNSDADVSITSPTNGQQVSGIVSINAGYTGNVAAARVELHVGSFKLLTDTQAPYNFSWNTTTWANGTYLLTTVSFDANGKKSTSPIVALTINNSATTDTTQPTVAISAPTGGTVSNSVTVSANATDNVGVTRVEFFINGQKIATDTSSPYAVSWNTATFSNSSYTLTAKAFDAAGNTTTSSSVSVTVNNAPTNTSQFKITAKVIGAGRMNLPEGEHLVNIDSNKWFAFYPSAGHKIDKIVVNGVNKGVASSYSVHNAQGADQQLEIYFVPKSGSGVSHEITASSGAHGTITSSGTNQVTENGSLAFTITPNTGYKINQVLIDGVALSNPTSTYTFSNVTSDHTIHVSFKEKSTGQFTITANVIGAGRMNSPEGEHLVNANGYKWFAFYPNAGHKIDKIVVNGVNKGVYSSYSVYSAQGTDQQLEVYFVPK